jgi:glycosyltransferase involved in cell wall biosynthesis
MNPEARPAPAVSVILPTHDRAHLLPRSVGSVLGQTWTDLELIVVDDGSTQDIQAALAPFKDDGRLRLVRQPQRSGGGAARNAGIHAARGKVIAFQDSDDEWLPRKLERQMEALAAAGPGVGVVYTGFWRESPAGRKRYPRADEPLLEGNLHARLLERNFITTAAALARREVLERAGLFDPAMPRYQDWDLWVRVARLTRFAFVADPLLVQHHQPDSISADDDARRAARMILLRKYLRDMRRYPGLRARQLREVARLHLAAGDARIARRLARAARWESLWDRFRGQGSKRGDP